MARRVEVKRFKSLALLDAQVSFNEKGGATLTMSWDGRPFLRMGLAAIVAMHGQVADAPPEELEGDGADEGAHEMARAYARVRRKYTGAAPKIGPESKYWKHMIRGAEQAKELGVDPDTYVEAIVDFLTRINPDQSVTMPWPSQLSSENAPMWVGDYRVRGTSNPDAQGKRKAKANAGIPLERDDEYKAIRRRMKHRKHTRADVAYVKARHTELYGGPKDWVALFEPNAIDAVKEGPGK